MVVEFIRSAGKSPMFDDQSAPGRYNNTQMNEIFDDTTSNWKLLEWNSIQKSEINRNQKVFNKLWKSSRKSTNFHHVLPHFEISPPIFLASKALHSGQFFGHGVAEVHGGPGGDLISGLYRGKDHGDQGDFLRSRAKKKTLKGWKTEKPGEIHHEKMLMSIIGLVFMEIMCL